MLVTEHKDRLLPGFTYSRRMIGASILLPLKGETVQAVNKV